MPSSTRNQRRRQPVRNTARRPAARVVEPPDYSRDYAYVRRDLLLIGLIGGLLLAAMISASFII